MNADIEKEEDKSDGFRDNGEPSNTPRTDSKVINIYQKSWLATDIGARNVGVLN